MTVSAPPRRPSPARTPPDGKPLDRDEIEALVEALIEEARREQRRRHRRYWALAALLAFVGVVLLILLEGGAASQPVSPAVSRRSSVSVGTPVSRIAFVQNHSPSLFTEADVGLYVINPDGSERRLVTRIADHTGGVWSPDGERLAFSRQRDLEHHGIYLVNTDGTGVRRLTSGADGGPAWSRDGRRLAFTRGPGRMSEIYVVNADGTNLRRLTRNRFQDFGPLWSPDGRAILFSTDRKGYGENYVMNADGSGQRPLTREPGFAAGWAAWSPDGRKIILTNERIGRRPDESGIFLMNADGSGLRRVVPMDAFQFRWSPDGRKIAFVGFESGARRGVKGRITVMNANGSGLHALQGTEGWAYGPDAEFGPVWSPDSRAIAFVSDRGGNHDIYVLNADGSGMQNVTRDPGTDISPAWAPALR